MGKILRGCAGLIVLVIIPIVIIVVFNLLVDPHVSVIRDDGSTERYEAGDVIFIGTGEIVTIVWHGTVGNHHGTSNPERPGCDQQYLPVRGLWKLHSTKVFCPEAVKLDVYAN